MRKSIFSGIGVLALVLMFPITSMAVSIRGYCRKNAKTMNRSFKSCVRAEEKARAWLLANPVHDDIYTRCKDGSGGSFALLKECAMRETYLMNARATSPLNINNSRAWYAGTLSGLFPSLIRVCGYERALDDFAVLPQDITKFSFSSIVKYRDMLPYLQLRGRVDITPLPKGAGIKTGITRYDLYIDAFLVSNDGKVIDISTTKAASPLSIRGGTARFSLEIGSGYYFDRGGSLIVLASGTPIKTDYPESTCAVLGAKKITFNKK